MYQAPLPEEYQELSAEETSARIKAAKAKLEPDLVILGHHYQRSEIIEHADFRGDSYKLCLDAGKREEAKFIVFCGVHFMAESAAVLTNKRVILPNLAAGCSMADMANILQVRRCWAELEQVTDTHEIIPITYINSAANLKAFVGERGGTVCTSTNAPKIVEWALGRGSKVLFLPDQHLGRNTAVALGFNPDVPPPLLHQKGHQTAQDIGQVSPLNPLRMDTTPGSRGGGIPDPDMVLWDPFKPLGGNTPEAIQRAKFILWKGHCSVHARFALEQVEKARQADPSVQILVHPECSLEVVNASDLYGSTEFIIKTVEAAPAGSSWAIGTEINLVNRLAQEYPDKRITCLDSQICPCSTMYRIHPSFLLWCLESLVEGKVMNEVKVAPQIAQWAKVALDRMIEITSGKPMAHVD
ncbi:MAG TPA: quinolinate synthase [Fimbriimonadaceae bacterium]|jgi:quinolinate synthase